MEDTMIRLLRAEEIECRVSFVNEKGVSLLLYKDARVDQRILDETFGIYGWKRSHQCIDGNLYCTVEVYDKDKGEWIGKQDVGTVGMTEKEKSQASDSFKRACFNWGIGRELYSAPFLWIPAEKAGVQRKGDKFCCNVRFEVQSIEYSQSREITGLVIVNEKGQAVYQMGDDSRLQRRRVATSDSWESNPPSDMPPADCRDAQWNLSCEARCASRSKNAGGVLEPMGAVNAGEEKEMGTKENNQVSNVQMDSLKAELKRTGVTMETVLDRYKIMESGQLSAEVYAKIMRALARTKSVA